MSAARDLRSIFGVISEQGALPPPKKLLPRSVGPGSPAVGKPPEAPYWTTSGSPAVAVHADGGTIGALSVAPVSDSAPPFCTRFGAVKGGVGGEGGEGAVAAGLGTSAAHVPDASDAAAEALALGEGDGECAAVRVDAVHAQRTPTASSAAAERMFLFTIGRHYVSERELGQSPFDRAGVAQ